MVTAPVTTDRARDTWGRFVGSAGARLVRDGHDPVSLYDVAAGAGLRVLLVEGVA